jgi:transcriptional regulator with XRE-family HTH domain
MLYGAVYMLTGEATTLDVVETMGSRITMLRQARGFSVPELAQAVGVTRALVWQWEQDIVKGIRPENFLNLCRVLGVTPDYLVWGPDRAPGPRPAPAGAKRG